MRICGITRCIRLAQLLRQTDHKISEVALMMGYENPSKFSEAFYAVMGCKPNAYRKSQKSSVMGITKVKSTGTKDSVMLSFDSVTFLAFWSIFAFCRPFRVEAKIDKCYNI